MMNNRIENLAQGCFEYIEGTLDGDIVEFDYKKFAELIVAECASICELQSYKHSFTPAKARLAESTSVYCGTLIKKHFGVDS